MSAAAQSAAMRTNMSTKFSAESIAAYRESSVAGISDLYQYLNILSDKASSTALRNEVRKNISMLFASDELMVSDVTSASDQKISLPALLDKIEGKGLTFSVRAAKARSETYGDYWLIDCMIGISDGTLQRQLSLIQKVYFLPATVRFGSTEKMIWSVKLGSTE